MPSSSPMQRFRPTAPATTESMTATTPGAATSAWYRGVGPTAATALSRTPAIVVVLARDEVGLELGREFEVGVADAIHSLHPASVLLVHLREAHDRHATEEIDDGQQDERERDEPVPKSLAWATSASATTEPVSAATKIDVRLIDSV